ncbi:hypothetical protein Lal_00007597 [Lupinus albus]|uniref:RING-type E3 ubiquitin transferase n=1 Tax=Lupinus albus TaxID=3870 RepID=A0A6A4P2T0_LUPAL|nr:putative transcription factor C2H2 family [Lupinus albus]KAF1874981.1 hypothetical protein Lal_00007597 [Lupinus albus]
MSSTKADDSESPPSSSYNSPPTLIALALALVVVCFVGFSIVYFCRCYLTSIFNAWAIQRSTSLGGSLVNNVSSSPNRGLDPSVLHTFPTFPYSTVKDLRKEKYSLECAICLLEFEDDSVLRLLTVCCHVFHQECIDLWLCSNKTCPVCRKELDSAIVEARNSQERGEDNNADVEQDRRDDVCIDVKESEDHHKHSSNDDNEEPQTHKEHMFSKSHSTGHSIVMIRGEDEGNDNDKYKLRLPEHVAVLKIIGGGGHNHSKSCSSYKDVTRHVAPCSNCGYVETVSGCSSSKGNQNV